MPRPEIKPLTSIRFFAAAAIVGHHERGIFWFPEASLPLHHAVPLFFVLSGFILTYRYVGLEPEARGRYFVSRVARIWPVHLFCLLVGFLLIPHFLHSLMQPDGWLKLLLQVFLLQDWVPSYGYAFAFNSVAWSISAEVFFYLLFPFLVVSVQRTFLALAIFAVLNLTIFQLGNDVDLNAAGALSEKHPLLIYTHLNPLSAVPGFLMGMLAGFAFERMRDLRLGTALATMLELAAAAFLFWWMFDGGHQALRPAWLGQLGHVYYSYSSPFLFMPVVLLIFAFAQGAISRILSIQFLVFLGKISFATYMIHQIIIRAADAWSLDEQIGSGMAILFTVAIIYAASAAIYLLVEEPARRALTKLAGRRNRLQAA